MDKKLTHSPSTPLRVTAYYKCLIKQQDGECHPERSRRAVRQQYALYKLVNLKLKLRIRNNDLLVYFAMLSLK
jgi:hypothetical protein